MLEKLYLFRHSSPDYNVSRFEAEASQPVMSATFSHREEEAAIITVAYELQQTTFGSGSRYGILCGVDSEGAFRVLARGEVVGYPVGLAGATVSVEIMCRRPDHVSRVDQLWLEWSTFVPPELDNSTDPRRAEMFVPKVVYHDPVILEPRLVPMEGEGAPIELYGEGASWGDSKILSIRGSVTEAPAESVTVGADAVFDERLTKPVDFGPEIGTVQTATPKEFKAGIRKMSAGGGDFFILSKEARLVGTSAHVYTSHKATIDPITCLVRPKKTAVAPVQTFEIDLRAAVTVVQRRREVAELKVIPQIWKMGGASDVAFDVSVYDAENLAYSEQQYQYQTGQYLKIAGQEFPVMGSVNFRNVRRSIFVRNDAIYSENLHVLKALVGQGVREAVQRAHCVQLSLSVTADAMEGIRVGGRVRVHDVRLPGGRATGKVVGIAMSWTSSATATLELSCPISEGTSAPGPDVTEDVGAGGGLIRVHGAFAVGPEYDPPVSGGLISLESNDSFPFFGEVTKAMQYESENGEESQDEQIAEISAANDVVPQFGEGRTAANDVEDIEDLIDGTTISVSFRPAIHDDDLESMTTRYSAGTFRIVFPEGVMQ